MISDALLTFGTTPLYKRVAVGTTEPNFFPKKDIGVRREISGLNEAQCGDLMFGKADVSVCVGVCVLFCSQSNCLSLLGVVVLFLGEV